MSHAHILWRRLDVDGRDACRLDQIAAGWRLRGGAIFSDDGVVCQLSYEVVCDAAWRTRAARVSGWRGATDISIHIEASGEGAWRFNGVDAPQAAGFVDCDLGFTPATNLIALRRMNLAIGAEAEAPAAYLVFPDLRFERLQQTYRRLSRHRYVYRSPAYGYDNAIDVDDAGFVVNYPGLWMAA